MKKTAMLILFTLLLISSASALIPQRCVVEKALDCQRFIASDEGVFVEVVNKADHEIIIFDDFTAQGDCVPQGKMTARKNDMPSPFPLSLESGESASLVFDCGLYEEFYQDQRVKIDISFAYKDVVNLSNKLLIYANAQFNNVSERPSQQELQEMNRKYISHDLYDILRYGLSLVLIASFAILMRKIHKPWLVPYIWSVLLPIVIIFVTTYFGLFYIRDQRYTVVNSLLSALSLTISFIILYCLISLPRLIQTKKKD